MKIAVIGGGTFGSMTALRLSEDKHSVTLYERLPSLMRGASYNNQNRLHLGFHYPRDDQTAQQCIKGFTRFREDFESCVLSGFANAYFIASEGSLTTPDDFISFCGRNGLRYDLIDLNAFTPLVQNVALGVLTDEVVYDSSLLRSLIGEKMSHSGVDIQTSHECTAINRLSSGGFELTVNGKTESFDAVVNCSYANINSLTRQLDHIVQTNQYEYTAVGIVELNWPNPAGITIMDGGFMTILPFGKTGKYLLYHVRDVVIARDDSSQLDPSWLQPETSPFASVDKDKWFASLVEHCSFFVPSLENAKLHGFLQGPRMVLAKREDTDARPSIVTQHEPGYITVFSGKIDHCVWVADEVLALLAK